MRTFTAAALIAVAQAAFPIAPSSPATHDLFCRLFGDDPRYGPCPTGNRFSFSNYEAGYFDQFAVGASSPAGRDTSKGPQDGKNKDYLKESGFMKLYPFADVSFFDQETHTGQFVLAEDKDKWSDATPEECDPCKALRELVEAQQKEIDSLRQHHLTQPHVTHNHLN